MYRNAVQATSHQVINCRVQAVQQAELYGRENYDTLVMHKQVVQRGGHTMTREQAEKELLQMLKAGEQEEGRYYTMEEVQTHLEEWFKPEHVVYLTGDTHGRFDRIEAFCRGRSMVRENTFIILGDVGLNYFGDVRDRTGKERLSQLPCTFFCIHGNHEQRPSPLMGYRRSECHGGAVWVEPQFPNIVFAIDGEVYDFCGHSCLVIGGAYSVDKWYRLEQGFHWWPDEQPSEEIREKVEAVLEQRNRQIDAVLSHTCPLKYEPREVFLKGLDQSTVDKSTEEWLGEIESRLRYKRWYCGHYHTEKRVDRLQFMFEDYAILPHELSIEKKRETAAKLRRQAEVLETLGLLNEET